MSLVLSLPTTSRDDAFLPMSEQEEPSRSPVVLVVLPNRPFFGASLVLVPALLHLRQQYRDARFIALANHGMGSLFQRWGLVDSVWRHDRSGGEPLTTFKRTLALRPRLLVNCRPRSTRLHLWSLLIPARERRCFRHGLGALIDPESRPWDTTRYKAFTYLGLVGAGWHDHGGDLLREWEFIPRATSSSNAMVLIPSGSSMDKKWPLERYLELAVRWRHEHGGEVQVLAGPGDPEVTAWVETPAARQLGLVLVKGGLQMEAVAIRSAAVVVGNDCGPNHLAQLMDRPRVVLFKPTMQPEEWFRPGPQAAFIRPTTPLGGLSVQEVWDAVVKVSRARLPSAVT